MNSPYQEICGNYEKPQWWDFLWSYKKYEKYPNNMDMVESFLTHSICVICFYLLEKNCQQYIQSVQLSESLEQYADIIHDILEWNDLLNENKWIQIYIGKSLDEDVHIQTVKTHDYVFSILGSQSTVGGVIYLQDYIEQEK